MILIKVCMKKKNLSTQSTRTQSQVKKCSHGNPLVIDSKVLTWSPRADSGILCSRDHPLSSLAKEVNSYTVFGNRVITRSSLFSLAQECRVHCSFHVRFLVIGT